MFKRIDYFIRPTELDIFHVILRHPELESIGVSKSAYDKLSKTSIILCEQDNIEIIIRK